MGIIGNYRQAVWIFVVVVVVYTESLPKCPQQPRLDQTEATSPELYGPPLWVTGNYLLELQVLPPKVCALIGSWNQNWDWDTGMLPWVFQTTPLLHRVLK